MLPTIRRVNSRQFGYTEVYPSMQEFSVPMSDHPFVQDDRALDSTYRRAVPAWLSSLGLHMLLVMVLAITIKAVPRGVAQQPDRTTGIVLKHQTKTGEYYEGEKENVQAASQSRNAKADAATVVAALPGKNDAPQDPSEFLPDANLGVGPPASKLGGGKVGLDGPDPGVRDVEGGKARTGVFGLTGEGYKFVYVFDASASMNSHQGRPLAAAKRELVGSLQSLGKLHQFQIIFYNELQTIFNPTGVKGRLFFATDDNKKAAESFVQSVEAKLSTDHLPALLTAVNMGPDVIFFLTDGEEPSLSPFELSHIERRNDGRAVIHVIQFGSSRPSRESWLKKLARQNGGKHTTFNLNRLSPRE